MQALFYIITLPILAGLLFFLIPDRLRKFKGVLATTISGLVLIFSLMLFNAEPQIVTPLFTIPGTNIELLTSWFAGIGNFFTYNIDHLGKLIVLFIGFFAFLISFYSIAYMKDRKKLPHYYSYLLITVGCAAGAALADNLILLIGFWGILGMTLYLLIKGYDEESSATAKKTLILIGASDALMIMGIGIIWQLTNSFSISEISIATDNGAAVTAFLLLMVGSFTKAGAFPFHSWIPDYAKKAPASSSALLPASLDKLLGIYLLLRLTMDMFQLNQWLTLAIILLGVTTIIIAVMMALVQHNFMRLLGYHAVSQVGYMVLGIGLGSPLGIIGGVFHMINNALYKSGLFLSGGNVEEKTGTNQLEGLGGLSKAMPITFLGALVFALSISGIPPLNGFASKWIIYQGIIEFGEGAGIANRLWIVWLSLAVVGSALTLASFIKFISGIFLGRAMDGLQNIKESNLFMWLPIAILAIICLSFGVFATSFVVPQLFAPLIGEFSYIGTWNAQIVSLLIVISVLLGAVIYYFSSNVKKFRVEDSFVGGERFGEAAGFSVMDFYKTLTEFNIISAIYARAEKKWFDIYDLTKKIVLGFSKALSNAHNGILSHYLLWVIIGFLLMLILMM
jgi:formate hydrogenlyase subunit 3/multisubunit Na+/H+ antiporter MnhD subunit